MTDDGSQGSDHQFDGNPSWGELLNEIPQELHAKVMPHLNNWDRGVQQQFREQAPWKEVLSSGLDPQTVMGAVGLAKSMETDPRGVWDAMADHYGFTPQQMKQIAQQAQEQEQEEPDPYADRWQTMQNMEQRLNLLSQAAVKSYQQQQEAQKAAEMDNELEAQIQEAKKKFGDAFNEDLALQLLQRDFSTVSEAWQFFLNGGGQKQQEAPYAPLVMGTGGGFPNLGNKRPAQMNDDEQASYVAQYLTHLQRAKQG